MSRVPEKHRRGIDRVVLYDVDDMYAPPERPVLELAVIGDTTFLTIRRLDENHREDKLTTETQIAVDTESFSEAFQAAIKADGLVAIPRDHLVLKTEASR